MCVAGGAGIEAASAILGIGSSLMNSHAQQQKQDAEFDQLRFRVRSLLVERIALKQSVA